MEDAAVARQLLGAELWTSGLLVDAPATAPAAPRVASAAKAAAASQVASAAKAAASQVAAAATASPVEAVRPALLAGWEDGAPFCATVCSTDVGLAFCRACPEPFAARTLATGRPSSGRCGAGVRLLAIPAARGDRTMAIVLRTAPPRPRSAARVADTVRIAPASLRRAAREADPADARATLGAARVLRDPRGLLAWQVTQRGRGADRRRTATAALAQMIATSEEFHELFRSSQRQRADLERNRRRLDRLARETLRANDEERAMMAHQIHDTAAQSMVSAFRFLEAARASASGLSGQTDENLAAAGERLQAAIREVRLVLNRMLPPGLEELGLGHAVESRLRELTAGTTIEANLTGHLPRLDPLVEQALYGMIAEAVANAIHHGQARRIEVMFTERRGRAAIVVKDDGVGFDPATIGRRADGGGLGLLGLTRQASWLGGRATIVSRPGNGATIRLSVPLAPRRPTPGASVGHHQGVPADGAPAAPAREGT